MVDVPHFTFPFRLDQNLDVEVIEQDSDDDVVQCVQVLLSTPTGSRVELPEYGIDDPTFSVDVDMAGILDSISDWEPRAEIDINDEIDTEDELLRRVRANVMNGGVAE